jgi:alkylated DNA repair dioxygenase AlkB
VSDKDNKKGNKDTIIQSPTHTYLPNQLIINLYDPKRNHNILPHNDCENGNLGPVIIGVNLLSDCTMIFSKPKDISGTAKQLTCNVFMPRRSVYLMTGEALRKWRHAIFTANLTAVRISLTYRQVSNHHF